MEWVNRYLTNRHVLVPALVLLLGLSLSLVGSKFLFDYTREQHQLWIERHAESQSEQLQISISSALNTLASISAFFRIQENICNKNRHTRHCLGPAYYAGKQKTI